MAQQLINSPGVQINEVDLSLRVNAPNGVGVLAMGFTSSGPTDEVIQLTSIEEYEEVYGKPTSAAERYSYHTAQALFDSPANIFFSRLPYGAEAGGIFTKDTYSALVYPVIPEYTNDTTYSEVLAGVELSSDSAISDFYLAAPTHVEFGREDYEKLINDELDWNGMLGISSGYSNFDDLASAGLIVLNNGKSTINEQYEGYYLGISDNTNTQPDSDFQSIMGVNSINDSGSNTASFIDLPEVRLDFELSSSYSSNIDSISVAMDNVATYDVIGDEFVDMLSIGLFKLRKTPFNNSAVSLSYALSESYFGSFDPEREIQNVNGGSNVSTFLEDLDDDSNNLEFFVNPYLQDTFTLDLSANPESKIRVLTESVKAESAMLSSETSLSSYADKLFPLGVYQDTDSADKTIGEVSEKIDRVLTLTENPDLFELDVVVEGGLGTIFCSTKGNSSDTYDETATWDSLSGLSGSLDGPLDEDETQANYQTIFSKFNTFCEKSRKDCIFIADPIRQIFVTGKNSRVLSQTVADGSGKLIPKTFSQYIDKYLKNQFRGANSSYSVVYGNWVKVYDSSSKKQVWVPYSGFGAGLMANMDYVWEAPAGLTRGINSNINDIAIYPKQKERDQLYKSSINPVTFFPNEGFVTWGQKTMLKKPSAFDRINVRRAFLFLEKATMKTSKYFVFEPNTLFTRTQVTNVLEPLFENVKNKDGIRDYIIVCNEKNNIDEVIEQNQLKIDIYIKPTKIAEFILVDFIATRQDASFQELIG